MNLLKILPLISLLLGLALMIAVVVAYPMWDKVTKYLNVPLIVIPLILGLGLLVCLYSLFLIISNALLGPLAWLHLLLTGIFIVAIFSPIFTSELGIAREIAWRYISLALPYAIWVGGWILFLLLAPHWRPLSSIWTRTGIIVILLLAPLAWHFIPFKVKIKTDPIVFFQQDGVVVAWETNMRSTAQVNYGNTEQLGNTTFHQEDGLKELSNRAQRVFLADFPMVDQLFYQAESEGVRNILPSFALKAGKAQSDVREVSFPEDGQEITLVAFSDIHEQRFLYRRLQSHIDWEQMDLALYLGDLINFSEGPKQAAHAILDMPTGDRNLPRVFARGNHETRGETARQLRNWLVPPGGDWYYTFEAGNTFFVVLDSGEDKSDNHPEYSGLNDFASYHQKQAAWLADVFASPEYQQAERRVVLIHIPLYFDYPPELAPVMELIKSQDDIDLVMSGHTHIWGIFMPEETGLSYPLTTCGGSQVKDMAAVVVHIGHDQIRMKLIDIHGNVIEEQVSE